MPQLEHLYILAPAFVVSIMISLTHIPFGFSILRRQIIFLDLAIAQICGLGIMIAEFSGVHAPILQQVVALLLAFFASAAFYMFEKKIRFHQEAMIGIVYVLSAALAILIASQMAHGYERFENLLTGEILFTTWASILWHAPIYIIVRWLFLAYKRLQTGIGFYILFSILVSSSVQLIGVFLVFTILVVPPLSALLLHKKYSFAYILSSVGLFLGLSISFFLDFPSAASIVIATILVCGAIVLMYKLPLLKYKNHE